MTRELKDGFLRGIIDYASETEIPDDFALWVGVSMISTSLCRKCFIDYRPMIFPNLYIVLVAESATCRKSTAIGLAEDFLTSISNPPSIFAAKSTPEGLIRTLKMKLEVEEKGSKIIEKEDSGRGIVIADELSTFLDKQAYTSGLIALLTKLYDSSGKPFTYMTAGRGKETISDPCLSILGGTTLNWLKGSIPPEAIGGGFTSRVVFVASKPSNRTIAWPRMTPLAKALRNKLIADLNSIRQIAGDFTPTQKARDFFERLYVLFLSESELKNEENLSGYAGRRHILLLKISMCVSASVKSSGVIDKSDIEIANELLIKAEEEMRDVLERISSTADGEMLSFVLKKIRHGGEIDHSLLMRQVAHKIRSVELDSIILTLQQSKSIEQIITGRRRYYKYLRTPK